MQDKQEESVKPISNDIIIVRENFDGTEKDALKRRTLILTNPIESDANISYSNISKTRIKAQEGSSWTDEEIALMDKWETKGSKKSRIHSRLSHKSESLNKWLRFATGLITTLTGSGSCISFFVKLSEGQTDWESLIFGIITFLSGLVASISDSFGWQKDSEDHKRAADHYRSIVSEIQMLRSNLKIDRRECEFWIHRLNSEAKLADDDAPYIEPQDFQFEEVIMEKKRKNSVWSAESLV